jgi:hypothetical protein
VEVSDPGDDPGLPLGGNVETIAFDPTHDRAGHTVS